MAEKVASQTGSDNIYPKKRKNSEKEDISFITLDIDKVCLSEGESFKLIESDIPTWSKPGQCQPDCFSEPEMKQVKMSIIDQYVKLLILNSHIYKLEDSEYVIIADYDHSQVFFGKMNVGDHGVELRSKAIGMLEGDITQKEVATRLSVGVRSVRRWWSQHKCGQIPSENYGLGNDVTQSAVRTAHCTPKQTVNGAYYRNEILKKTCLDAIARKAKKGSVIERSMLENMSEFLFMQDGAPAHTANVTQQWCSEKFPRFGRKGSGQLAPPT
ncbi:Arylsulfatase B-like [Oopsacas minuta]|uniref:Arylsulfatase B-like n=1 Tax=Oopsacas minuta TaxID=111878 RepID=A0AAV7JIK9_9METZ|nr:Arylsulfatase B-like [Oopsacas minuta]